MKDQLRNGALGSIRFQRRETLESDHVACHGGNWDARVSFSLSLLTPRNEDLTVFVPEPFGSVHITSNAARTVRTHQLSLLLGRHVGQSLGEARPNDDDIARLELDSLLLRHLLDIFRRERVGVERIELDPILIGVALVVDENTPCNETATLVPVVQRRQLLITVFIAKLLRQLFGVGLNAVVALGALLVVDMAKTVPLARALGVELELVVVAVCVQRSVQEADDRVLQAFASETGRGDGSQWPVQGDRHAVSELRVGGFDDVWGEEVEGSVDVFLSVFVEHAPSTALRHTVDLWKAVEVWDSRHVVALSVGF